VVDDDDPVGALSRRESVCDEDGGASFEQAIEGPLDDVSLRRSREDVASSRIKIRGRARNARASAKS